jgi:hypothetical protein
MKHSGNLARRLGLGLGFALTVAPATPAADVAAPPSAGQEAAPGKGKPRADSMPPALSGPRFPVRYRSSSNVYLQGGRAQGLVVGDRLVVLAGKTTVAELEVVYVAEASASCRVLAETRPVRAGDEAALVARAAPTSAKPGAPPAPATSTARVPPTLSPLAAASSSPTRPWARLRGAAAVGYYRSWDQTESGLDFEQRTARFDLSLDEIGGQPLSFTLRGTGRRDIRARTLSSRTPADGGEDRLYEVAVRYEPPSDRLGLEVGRIGLYRFVGIGYLDGALARLRVRPALQVGAFGGRQAEIESLGLAGTGAKYGAFVRLAPGRRYAIGGYDVRLAYVRENAEGDVSREYLSLESRFAGGGRWSIFERAELDLNRGWRQELTGTSHQLSNMSLSGNLRVSASSWAFVSYDGRRNYRYYLNRQVPEEVFDGVLHQGLRAGLTVAKPGGFGASVGVGMSLKEPDPLHPELDRGNAYSFNAGVRHSNLFASGFSAGIDGSGFTNGYADGGLLSGHVGWRLPAGHTLDFSYGYSLYRVADTKEDRTNRWLRLGGRAELGRRLYVLGNFEYDAGDDLKGPRGFLELGVVF